MPDQFDDSFRDKGDDDYRRKDDHESRPHADDDYRHRDDDDDDDYDRPRRRDYVEPHRGTMILVFGILGVVLSPFLPPSPGSWAAPISKGSPRAGWIGKAKA